MGNGRSSRAGFTRRDLVVAAILGAAGSSAPPHELSAEGGERLGSSAPPAAVRETFSAGGPRSATAMPYYFLNHTGDVAARVRGATLDALFADAALALTATLVEADAVRPAARHELSLGAASPDQLLVDWLNELVYRFDVDGWLVARAQVRVCEAGGTWRLEAVVAGEPFDRTRHTARVPVKGATYHRLAIDEVDNGFETTVVFDV